MFSAKVVGGVLQAIESSPSGIASLDVLESLRLAGPLTLKTTLSRLNKSSRIVRLKRGVYSANPIQDAFACAQALFNGYIGFASALYLHKLIAEVPFTIVVVTVNASKTRVVGNHEFKAVALKEKAAGFERAGNHVVSTRAKTLFDCLYLPKYSVEQEKLYEAFKQARLSANEWGEFEHYAKKLVFGKTLEKIKRAESEIRGGE